MKPIYVPTFRRQRSSGIVQLRIITPRGGQWLSTGQTSYLAAKQVCDAAKIAELQMAACSQSLSHEVVSRLLTGRAYLCEDILQAWREEAMLDLRIDSFHNYESTLKQWIAFCACAKSPLSAIKRCHMDSFVNEEGVGLGTRKGRLAALRSFYKFASASGYCVGNAAERVKVKTFDILFAGLEPHHHEPFTEEEFRLLMSSPMVPAFWRCAVALSYSAGLRLRDVCCLQRASITPDALIVFTKKSGARVELPLDAAHVGGGELRQVCADILAQSPTDSKFCFPKRREQILSPTLKANLSRDFHDILVRHGIKGKSFHGLRGSYARRMKAAGLTTEMIAGRLGHANTATTELYLDHAD